ADRRRAGADFKCAVSRCCSAWRRSRGSVSRGVQPVLSGADGQFLFRDVAAGPYRVAATADGFVRQEFGQRTVTGQGRPLFVVDGQALKDVAIRLLATGTVTGRVFDEKGQPTIGVPIQVLRPVYNIQGRNLQAVATVATDDRGEYRAYGVPPGRYYLIAGTPPGQTARFQPGALGAAGIAGSTR